MRKLKTHEKLIGGLTLHPFKSSIWTVDINPSIGYRLTSYWSIGSGWSERVIGGQNSSLRKELRVYGPRTFTEVLVCKGISLRIDVEQLNTYKKPEDLWSPGERINIYTTMIGLKKSFSFYRSIIGNGQFMYNIHSSEFPNAYTSKFNVRFGFERIIFKQRKKETNH